MSGREAVAPAPRTARLAWLPAGPAEGWVTLGLVALMAVVVGWSLDDPGWVVRRLDLTDFLPAAALLGAIAGFLTAKAGMRRWTAHLVGALAAAIVLPVFVGAAMTGTGTPIDHYFVAADSTIGAWVDLAIRRTLVTQEVGHHLLAFGIMAWGTGQFATYTVFGHRRPIDAVTVVGLVLIGSIAATFREQVHLLVVFSAAALLLLVRSHAMDEQTAWARRRIGDPAAVRSLYLRGGSVFIVLAVVGSVTLTVTAASAPLQGLWGDVPQRLAELGSTLQRVLPAGGARQLGAVAFGPSTTITGSWVTNDNILLRVTVPRAEADRKFYWRMAAYADYEFNQWTWGPTETVDVEAGLNVLDGLADDPAVTAARREIVYSVEPAVDGFRGSQVLGPQAIVSLDVDASLKYVVPGGFFATLERVGTDGYTATALVPIEEDVDGGLTKNRLRVAGRDYPLEISTRYRRVPPGTLGPESRKLLDQIRTEAGPLATPYDLAETMVRILRDGEQFQYKTNVTDIDCGTRGAVECFAWSKVGYCQYYATTMIMLLRTEGIPARLAQGFLPGTLDPATSTRTIRSLDAHAWVEVYFPGYGWVSFDPTGGNVAQAVDLPEGSPQPTPDVTPSPTLPLGTRGLDEETDPLLGPGGAIPPVAPSQTGPFVAIAALLVLAFGVLSFMVWQRGPRGGLGPDAAWRGVSGLAARFGFGPRPSQTVFEYAGSLGDVLPTARPELQTVAGAKVAVAYGRQDLDADRLRAVRDAHRRLRVGLLRLALLRKDRWSRSGGFFRRPGRRRG